MKGISLQFFIISIVLKENHVGQKEQMLYESILYLIYQRNCLKFILPWCHCLTRLLTISYCGNNSDFPDNFKIIMSCCLRNAVLTWKKVFLNFFTFFIIICILFLIKAQLDGLFYSIRTILLIMVFLEICIFQVQTLTEHPQLTGHFSPCLTLGTHFVLMCLKTVWTLCLHKCLLHTLN